MIHQGSQIISERVERDSFFGADWFGLSMCPRVKTNQPDAWRRRAEVERLRQVGAQAVLKKERNTRALVAVVKLNPVVLEERHASDICCRRQFVPQEFHARRSIRFLEPVHDKWPIEFRRQ